MEVNHSNKRWHTRHWSMGACQAPICLCRGKVALENKENLNQQAILDPHTCYDTKMRNIRCLFTYRILDIPNLGHF